MMIATLLALALNSPSQAHAQGPAPTMARPPRPPGGPGGLMSPPLKGENAPVERDLIMACAVTRMSTALANAPAFQAEKADLAARAKDMAKVSMRSKKAQEALAKSGLAKDAGAKQKIWSDLATSIGLAKWQCPSIGEL